MDFLTDNIRHLRRRAGLTQQQFADRLEIKRSLLGAYEEGRAYPKIAVIQRLAEEFGYSIDALINRDLQVKVVEDEEEVSSMQVLPIVVDRENRELIPIVPEKASAGYPSGFSDPEFIRQLPVFSMPVPELSSERTFRVFQIKGDSMLPVQSGDYIFCEYMAEFSEMREGHPCIIVTRDDGILYKRIYPQDREHLLLVSDNKEYRPFSIANTEILEVWKAHGILSFHVE